MKISSKIMLLASCMVLSPLSLAAYTTYTTYCNLCLTNETGAMPNTCKMPDGSTYPNPATAALAVNKKHHSLKATTYSTYNVPFVTVFPFYSFHGEEIKALFERKLPFIAATKNWYSHVMPQFYQINPVKYSDTIAKKMIYVYYRQVAYDGKTTKIWDGTAWCAAKIRYNGQKG